MSVITAWPVAAPERFVWGTDWPYPQMDSAPAAGLLCNRFAAWVPYATTSQHNPMDDPAELYGV